MTPVTDPWTGWPVGARVVVRRRLAEGGYSDVIGHILQVDAAGLLLLTRSGEQVAVAAAEIAVGKLVPPAVPRRGRRASPPPV